MAALERVIPFARQAIEDLRQKGVNPADLSEVEIGAMAAPFLVRGVLVKELSAHGVMSPEANEKMGIDTILEELRETPKGKP